MITIPGLRFSLAGDVNNLYWVDSTTYTIRKAPLAGGVVRILAGVSGNYASNAFINGIIATQVPIRHPLGIWAANDGTVYFTDYDAFVVCAVEPNGNTISLVAGTWGTYARSPDIGNGGLATAGTIAYPWGIAGDNAGNLYICDTGRGEIRKIMFNGQ